MEIGIFYLIALSQIVTTMKVLLILILLQIGRNVCQTKTVQPQATEDDCICIQTDPICSCTFIIEYRLTMILDKERQLIYPDNGMLKTSGSNSTILTPEQVSRVMTADGAGSRRVIAINGKFPGPRIEVYENQTLNLTVRNHLETDSVTIHFHGQQQRSTPWMDGVAFITQCPVLAGQTFMYSFKAFPSGTFFYHSHIGGQRGMGLYGPLMVIPVNTTSYNEIIITLQDWNHLMDPETAYLRSETGQFNFQTGDKIPTTYSVDSAGFEEFEFQSGLVNGKGRFWNSSTTTNGSPLQRFDIKSGITYRFRVIGSMTVYPMRVYIQGQKISLYGSDGFDLEHQLIQSIIVHTGERYDFLWTAPENTMSKQILFVAETIESPKSLNYSKYHAAEAVLDFVDVPGEFDPNPLNHKLEKCTSPCITFNCPFQYYPITDERVCLNYNDVNNIDPIRNPSSIGGNIVDAEYFFNFGFPGGSSSVNGRKFVRPTTSLLTTTEKVDTCNDEICTKDGLCECTNVKTIESNKVIQMVFLNLGNGAFASHPIHLHGHSFYVMKVGLGYYNKTTATLVLPSKDINCTDPFDYCSTATWSNSSWGGGNLPQMNEDPPQKDTIVVPKGGYVVIRILSDNPGMWFLHCHIDMHQLSGMAMVINESGSWGPTPSNFPTCHNFMFSKASEPHTSPEESRDVVDNKVVIVGGIVGSIVAIAVVAAVVVWRRRIGGRIPEISQADDDL